MNVLNKPNYSFRLACILVNRGGSHRRPRGRSPYPLRVRGVGHVCPRRLLHGLLVELVFGERRGTQWAHPQRRGDADL